VKAQIFGFDNADWWFINNRQRDRFDCFNTIPPKGLKWGSALYLTGVSNYVFPMITAVRFIASAKMVRARWVEHGSGKRSHN
jgi:hypothetical protein